MINPKNCPHDQPYQGTVRGERRTMMRSKYGGFRPWLTFNYERGSTVYVDDEQVSDLVPLVPGLPPRIVSTAEDFAILPLGAVVVMNCAAHQRGASGWYAADWQHKPVPSNTMAALAQKHGPAHVVWTPDQDSAQDVQPDGSATGQADDPQDPLDPFAMSVELNRLRLEAERRKLEVQTLQAALATRNRELDEARRLNRRLNRPVAAAAPSAEDPEDADQPTALSLQMQLDTVRQERDGLRKSEEELQGRIAELEVECGELAFQQERLDGLSRITDKPLPDVRREDGYWYADGECYGSTDYWTIDVLEARVRAMVAIRERLMDEKAARDAEKETAVVEARARALYEAICPDIGPFEDVTPTMQRRWLGLAADPDKLRAIADMNGGV